MKLDETMRKLKKRYRIEGTELVLKARAAKYWTRDPVLVTPYGEEFIVRCQFRPEQQRSEAPLKYVQKRALEDAVYEAAKAVERHERVKEDWELKF